MSFSKSKIFSMIFPNSLDCRCLHPSQIWEIQLINSDINQLAKSYFKAGSFYCDRRQNSKIEAFLGCRIHMLKKQSRRNHEIPFKIIIAEANCFEEL